MPTNREYLDQLASESPDKLKAWFDAEHNDNLAVEKVVSCDAAHSNDGNAHLKASEDLSDGFADSREKLEADVRSSLGFTTKDVFEWLDRQAAITADANKELIKWQAATVARLQKEVDELTDSYEASSRALEILTLDKAELQTQLKSICTHLAIEAEGKPDILASLAIASIDALISERDNLAADLLTCNREREQLRKHLGIALDHAHDICSLVDIDGNVLDVGD